VVSGSVGIILNATQCAFVRKIDHDY